MVSIKDVAKRANVSVTVVSKALNGYPDVKEETRKKVLLAAEELKYFPNMMAKNLKQKKTKKIALIFSNFERADGRDGLLIQTMNGIFGAAGANQYEVAIYTRSLSEQQDKSYWQFCKEHKISGAIITGLKTTDPYFQEIINSDFPCVAIDTMLTGPFTGSVSTDNVKASKEAVEFFLDRGHRKIGMVNGHEFAVVSKQRLKGYQLALEERGILYDPSIVINANFSEEEAYHITEEYINRHPDVTGIFFASDMMAIGFMNRCRELEINIPKDISVMGFDDIVLANYVTPKLSTIRQDFQQIANIAFQQVVQIIELKEGTHITVPYQLVDRDTIQVL
ncbi:LacI family DNA-binding transcriptional regulator [Bacillus sp. FJAT-49711]|uniref:LacI family DNA-binding transcriptional regulator n=1 Tax=Bacillus sp. FJAT-49711 TaxID=2833585 RepID=UPI001BCA3A71|nr:LacI family DNA-binding transcriptional regulator [Bacillus sp. FJAT-49711]MBS4219260.1 LacI family DNA-binding transcriptional regulator [Bacillus sp. FJAT-49711]